MSAPLHQLTLTFDPIEDRMLLRIGTAKNTEYHLWLTRRFIKVLWEALMKILDRTIEFQEPRAKQDKNIEKGMGNADNDTIKSPYQEGQYLYAIIGGSGTGNAIVSPIFVVVDNENPEDFYKYYKP